ncbi:hypothetical protein ACIQCF_35935 [Streptomyces sp. NPDC088353]|uniref:hypothetical protein n=1 Tax=Streptomyces sp. NPDC088353 TaxID=3365855 RepID=UPI00380D7034
MEDLEITIKLTRDEATILSDWLERLQMTDLGDMVDDPAAGATILGMTSYPIAPGRADPPRLRAVPELTSLLAPGGGTR